MNSKFNAISIKIPVNYFIENYQLIIRFIWNVKRQYSQYNPEEEEPSWRTDTTQLQDLVVTYSNQNTLAPVRE